MAEYSEPRHAASHDGARYFKGSIQEAIGICRSKKAFLLVFLEGENEDSYRADQEIHANLARNDFHCIALRLHDDLHNTDSEAFKGAKAFREIFPAIRRLPFFMILGPDGKELACLEGGEIALYSAQAIRRAAASFPKPFQEGSATQPQRETPTPRSLAGEVAGSAAAPDNPTTFDSSPSSSRSTSEAGSRQASAAPSRQSGSLPTVETPSSSMGLGFRTARQIPEDAFVANATPWSRKSGKQSDIGEVGSALLAASQQAAQVAAFHQRNAAWSESVNTRNWNHPSRASPAAQPGRSPSSASSRFGQGSDWSKYFSPIPPLGPPQPESPARSPSQSTAHSSMHASPIASPQVGLHAGSQPASPHSSMQASPIASPQVGAYAGAQPEFPPTPSLAEHTPATAGTRSPERPPHHLSYQPWQQTPKGSSATSSGGFAPEGPADPQSAAFAEPRLTSGVSTAPQASQPVYSGGLDTHGEHASPRLPGFAEREISPRRSRGSDTAQPYSPPLPVRQDIQHDDDRPDLDRQEPANGRAYNFPSTPESQLSEQTPVRNAFPLNPQPEQVEVSSAEPHASQHSGPLAATQEPAPEDPSEGRILESAAKRTSAEPLGLPAYREDESRPQTNRVGAGTLADREDEKMEVPAEGSQDWYPKEDDKIEVPTEQTATREQSAVEEPLAQPFAEDTQPEPSAEKFRSEPAAEKIWPTAASEAEPKTRTSSRSSPHSSPFSSPASQSQADQTEAIQGLKAAIQHNLDNLQDSSTATSAKQPLQDQEDTVEAGRINRKLASFGSLAEALPDYEDDTPAATPHSVGGFGVGEASNTSATATDPSATAAGVPDVNASHTWTPSQEHIIPSSPNGGEQSIGRDTFGSGSHAEPTHQSESFQGDENAPPSSLQTLQHSTQSPHSLAGKDTPSHASQVNEAEATSGSQRAAPIASSNEDPVEGYTPPSPRDVGLTSRDLDSHSPSTPRGIQAGSPFDDAPFTPRSRQTKSPFGEEQPDESAAESPRDASLAQKAKDEASDAALEEAENYNKRFGPSRGSDALRAVEETGSAAAIAAQRAKDGATATSEQPLPTAGHEPKALSAVQIDQTELKEKSLAAYPGHLDTSGLLQDKEAEPYAGSGGTNAISSLSKADPDGQTRADAADTIPQSESFTSYNNNLFKAQPSVDDSSLSTRTSAQIAFRLTNGRSLRGEFAAETTLEEVVDFVDEHRTDGTRPYLLRTPFPYRLLDTSQYSLTLKELDLCPRSVLVLQPSEQSNKLAMSRKGLPEVFLEYVQTYFMALAALLLGFFSGIFGSSEQQAIREHSTSQGPGLLGSASPSDRDDASSHKGGQVRGSNGAPRGQSPTAEDDRRPDQNDYYNGNSTEFTGDA